LEEFAQQSPESRIPLSNSTASNFLSEVLLFHASLNEGLSCAYHARKRYMAGHFLSEAACTFQASLNEGSSYAEYARNQGFIQLYPPERGRPPPSEQTLQSYGQPGKLPVTKGSFNRRARLTLSKNK
jgi:hypothetical protein